ncbi:MAG: hypothetical protein IJH07_01310 [Ruminococcus sp.]|nr:hypothetical protein [Ruminococcus sp.]
MRCCLKNDFGYTGPVEQVSAVNIHIDVPTAGAHPDFTPLTEEPDKVRVKVAYWYLSEEPYPHLSASDTFEAGKTYTVRLEIEGNQGYSVDTKYTTVSINGTVMTAGTYSYGNNFIGKQKSFTVTSVLLGDVDGDGEVEIRDATWIQRKIAGMELPFVFVDKRADVDSNNEITIMDATLIQRRLANLKTPYPIGETV